MPVWHVYRSFDVAPTGKHLRRFDDDTVLEWFQRNWRYLAVEDRRLADQRLIEVLGYGGWPLFHADSSIPRNAALPPPGNIEDVLARMRESFEEQTGGLRFAARSRNDDRGRRRGRGRLFFRWPFPREVRPPRRIPAPGRLAFAAGQWRGRLHTDGRDEGTGTGRRRARLDLGRLPRARVSTRSRTSCPPGASTACACLASWSICSPRRPRTILLATSVSCPRWRSPASQCATRWRTPSDPPSAAESIRRCSELGGVERLAGGTRLRATGHQPAARRLRPDSPPPRRAPG